MKILALADEECKAIWDYYTPGCLDSYDLLISCGDLKAEYLSFLVTMCQVPLFYVPGNHDGTYLENPPEGCDDIDGRLVTYRGLRILGLGGSMRYRNGPYQYTERQMQLRIMKLRMAIARAGGVDLVITHAPPRGLGDLDDMAHRGFSCFVDLIDRYHPLYFLHGHVHLRYEPSAMREIAYGQTKVVNASERVVIEIPERE